MKKQPKPKRGGTRPGAGRPPGDTPPRVKTSMTLAPDVLEYLNSHSPRSRSDVIHELVTSSDAFNSWRKQNSE